jgi:hypothetical protein
VRAVVIEVTHVPVKNNSGVSLVVDQESVGALGADAPNEPFRVAVRLGRPRRDRDHGDAFRGQDGIKGGGEFGVPVADRIRKRKVLMRSPRSISRLRAAWVVQAAVGWAVTPRRRTLRVRTSMTNRTYKGRSATVSRVKKSVANSPEACAEPAEQSDRSQIQQTEQHDE